MIRSKDGTALYNKEDAAVILDVKSEFMQTYFQIYPECFTKDGNGCSPEKLLLALKLDNQKSIYENINPNYPSFMKNNIDRNIINVVEIDIMLANLKERGMI